MTPEKLKELEALIVDAPPWLKCVATMLAICQELVAEKIKVGENEPFHEWSSEKIVNIAFEGGRREG